MTKLIEHIRLLHAGPTLLACSLITVSTSSEDAKQSTQSPVAMSLFVVPHQTSTSDARSITY